ncbi:MAG: vitamin B12 dependent methionine synthase [Deltaproteobacteria bacterium]|nr:vitamin B12 dependent methionine synthase [Deltaproteobacteria bacterium]
MARVVLDPLEYRIDRPSLLAGLCLKEGSGHAEKVEELIREAEAVAHPRAIYRMAFIESQGDRHVVAEGLRFESRVLKVNLDNLHRFFAFVVTAGRELDGWANARTDLLERFWADAINQAVVISARSFLDRHLQERYGLAKTARMSPGSLPDWPLEEQRVLFELLGDTRKTIGVELTESLLMVPVKSVSGIVFTSEEGFASCRLCPREGCPGRRVPYDPELYARKYRDPSQTSRSEQS